MRFHHICWLLLLCCGLTTAQTKPTLGTVDQAVRQNAADQAAAAKAAEKAARERTNAERAATARSVQNRNSTDLEQYKQEQRFKLLEDGLHDVEAEKAREVLQAETDRKEAVATAKADHEDLIKTIRSGIIGGLVSLVVSIVLLIAKGVADRRHHLKEERTLTQIHTLVNSSMTERMQSELSALQLLEIVASREANPSSQALEVLVNTKGKIAELENQLHERRQAAPPKA